MRQKSKWQDGGGRKCMNLIKCLAERSGDGITDLLGHILLLCDVLHQIIDLVNVPEKARGEISNITVNFFTHLKKLSF